MRQPCVYSHPAGRKKWFTPRDAADKLRDKFSEEFLKYVRELN